MAPDPYRRMYGSTSTGARGWTPPDASYSRLQLDNLLRRELKIADPTNAEQVASALLERYKGAQRALAIEQEARGTPFVQLPAVAAPIAALQTASSIELQQAENDVERDLRELTTNTLLKDLTPEMEGWAQSVRSALREGTNAARFGLDPRQRDKAMAIRRQLGDYARLARLVGALTPNMSQTYRKFAQSLDEIAALLLVMIGESLANAGFNGGQYLLQVPYTELQVRRDAAIYALRNLVGATQEAYGPSEWPRGLDAYRRLYEQLEAQGQGDLRSLLGEEELARTMDELIHRAAHGNPEGLRALGATAQLDLERFRRLIMIGRTTAVPESPPLVTFLEALQLFADAFTSAGGFRLVRIARPPILLYGFYSSSGIGRADQVLLDVVVERNRLADLLDCFLGCGCGPAQVECQILLDKLLYDLDRIIDLYALGTEDFGEPERRAAAYAFVIDAFEDYARAHAGEACVQWAVPPDPESPIQIVLSRVRSRLRPPVETADPSVQSMIGDLRTTAGRVREELRRAGDAALVNLIGEAIDALPNRLPDTIRLRQLTRLYRLAWRGLELLRARGVLVRWPGSIASFFDPLTQELCIHRRAEERWQQLVATLAPSCLQHSKTVVAAEGLVVDALKRIGGACLEGDITIPPDRDTSLDNLVNGTTVTGFGRWP